MNEPSAFIVSVGSTDDLDNYSIPGFENAPKITVPAVDLRNVSTEPQHQWRCHCGDHGSWGTDRDVAIQSAREHANSKGCSPLSAWLETIEPYQRVWSRWARRNARAVRPRRSRQNRSARARGARRLRNRVSPPPPLPPMTITLGGRR